MDEKAKRTWMEAAVRWINESSHKRSLKDDKFNLRWLSPFLKDKLLEEIDRDLISKLIHAKEKTGAKVATVNRLLALIRECNHAI